MGQPQDRSPLAGRVEHSHKEMSEEGPQGGALMRSVEHGYEVVVFCMGFGFLPLRGAQDRHRPPVNQESGWMVALGQFIQSDGLRAGEAEIFLFDRQTFQRVQVSENLPGGRYVLGVVTSDKEMFWEEAFDPRAASRASKPTAAALRGRYRRRWRLGIDGSSSPRRFAYADPCPQSNPYGIGSRLPNLHPLCHQPSQCFLSSLFYLGQLR